MNTVLDWLLNRPALLRSTAAVFWRFGCSALAVGVVAAMVNVILGVAGAASGTAPATFESLAGGLPTWWIPQTAVGLAAYLSVMLAAYMLNELGLELERMQRA